MSTVRVIQNKQRLTKEGNAPLYITFYLGKEKLMLPCKVSVPAAKFDEKSGLLKGNSKEAKDINLIVSNLKARVNDILVKFRLRNQALTKDIFMREYNNPSDYKTFHDFVKEHMKTYSRRIEMGTFKHHLSCMKKFKAYNGQGCEMKDKFRENFWIALPAAVATLILILILSFQTEIQGRVIQPYHLTQVIPYVLVLIGGIVGINVFVVLLTGIVSGAFIMLIGGHTTPVEILKNMGSGVSGMFETCMVAILVAAMCALIREYGGFDALLSWIHKIFRGKKGGQLGMGLLVGTMDIATANNTVAIVMANPIAKEMAEEYGITPRKTASILDTFSCVFQGVIPYGAQMLVAISAVNELGGEISAFQIMPKLFYPMLLLFSSLITIMRGSDRTGA